MAHIRKQLRDKTGLNAMRTLPRGDATLDIIANPSMETGNQGRYEQARPRTLEAIKSRVKPNPKLHQIGSDATGFSLMGGRVARLRLRRGLLLRIY